MTLNEKIQNFTQYLDRKLALDNALALVCFDQSTGAPKGGAAARAKTVGILSGESFSMSVSNTMKEHIEGIKAHLNELDTKTAAMVRICERDLTAMEKIPKDEFIAYSELLSNAELVWQDAKQKKEFAVFAPVLSQIITYLKRFTEYRGYEGSPYNTLLDDYEPGLTTAAADKFFSELKAGLMPIIERATKNCKSTADAAAKHHVDIAAQEQISRLLMTTLCFDWDRGLLKVSEHPFTSGFGRGDVRITTHYYENAFLSAFYSTIHETGHAIYEQNTDESLAGTILDTGISMGIHESQSRFYENIIGRSSAFWEYIRPRLSEFLPPAYKNITDKELFLASNRAEPSLIRIEADELTYNLHIIIRYELEKYIFETENLDVNELPALWNEKYKEYLGLTPENDAQGILQDVHWSAGLFGYFPSYSLGNAYAAQLYHYMNEEFNVTKSILSGDFIKIRMWLTDKIHRHGSVYLPNELITSIKGESLNAKYFIDYLSGKYNGSF